MGTGFEGSSLAFFTGLTPAGAVAFACLALYLLCARGLDEEVRRRVNYALALPLAIAWAGLIAAAQHLGTPANALYAFSAVGTSPLSNEVACVVAFLFVTGVRWLYGFALQPRRVVDAALLVAGLACAALLLVFTSTAYAIETVPSWDTGLVPACIVSGAACAGFSSAALCLALAAGKSSRRACGVLLALAAAALVVNTAVLIWYADFLAMQGNNVVAPGALAGAYGSATLMHVVMVVVGLALQARAAVLAGPPRRAGVLTAMGCALVLVSTVMVRFPFYEAYLSVGF